MQVRDVQLNIFFERRSRIIYQFVFCIIFLCTPPLPVYGSSITPTRQTAVVDPGESEVIEVRVTNNEEQRSTFVPEISGFTIDNKTGMAFFDQEDGAEEWFVVTPKQLILAPQEIGIFSFAVSVPEKAEPGLHTIGLFVSQDEATGQVSVTSRTASLFFLYVGGIQREDVAWEAFTVESVLNSILPISLQIRFRNAGTVHIIPKGELVVRNMFGREVQRLALNQNNRKLLPDDVWDNEHIIDHLSWKDVGRLQVTLRINYGLTNRYITDTLSFWYIPFSVFGVVVLMFVGVVIIINLKGVRQKRGR